MLSLYLFPGQGATIQAPERDLVTPANSYVFKTLDNVMQEKSNIPNFSEKKIFSPDSNVTFTPSETQASSLAVSLAKAVEEEARGHICDVCAGDSFGEWSMIAFAEVLGDKKSPESLKKTFNLVIKRGELTNSCKPEGAKPTKEISYLVMVVGVDRPLIDKAVADIPPELGRAWVSKVNAEKSIGIGGDIIAVKYAIDYLIDTGVPRRYCIPVDTDSPVHTPLMEKARKGMEDELKDVPFQPPNKKIIMTYSGKVETDPNTIKKYITNVMSVTADLNRSIVAAVGMGVRDVLCATVCRMYKKMIKRRKDVVPVN